jgi:hypothetical protein
MVQTTAALMLVIVLLLSCSSEVAKQATPSQETGKPDISARQAKEIPPFPPGHIFVKASKRGFVVTWKVNALDPTLTYKVYRTSNNSTVPIADDVKGGVFVDKNPPRGNVAYAVSTVNQYRLESVPSKPVVASK